MAHYFEILELEYTEDIDIIKKQYKMLMKKFHPDVCKDDNAEYKTALINEAYDEILKYISNINNNTKYNHEEKNIINTATNTAANNTTNSANNVNENQNKNAILEYMLLILGILLYGIETVAKYSAKQFMNFINYVINKQQVHHEKKEFEYCTMLEKKLGLDHENAYNNYIFYKNNTSIKDIDYKSWLKNECDEKRYLELLRSNRNYYYSLYTNYINQLQSYQKKISFNEYLKHAVSEVKKMIKELESNYNYESAEYDKYLNFERNNNPLIFTDWLDIKCRETNALIELKSNRKYYYNLYINDIKKLQPHQKKVTFVEYLENSVFELRELIKELKSNYNHESAEYDDYFNLNNNNNNIEPLDFFDWLDLKVYIKNLIEKLGNDHEYWINEYKNYKKNCILNGNEIKSFQDFLQHKVDCKNYSINEQNRINAYINSLGLDVNEIKNAYIEYCYNVKCSGNYPLLFVDWLQMQVDNTNNINNTNSKVYKKV